MAGTLSDDGADAALDAILGSQHSAAWPAIVYIAVAVDPALTEPTDPAYARVGLANDDTSFPPAVNRSKVTGIDAPFLAATADWGVVTHFAVMDSVTGGVSLGQGALDAPQNVVTGDTPRFPAGSLSVSL